MGFTIDKVVPWGRSYEEYLKMFDHYSFFESWKLQQLILN